MGVSTAEIGLLGVKILTLLVSVFIGYAIIYNRFLSPLRSFPGPWLNSVTTLPSDIDYIRGIPHKRLTELHAKYGKVVRFRPNELSYIDAAIWKDVFASRPGSKEFGKADIFMSPNGVLGILSSAKDDHRRYRRLLAYPFSNQGLKEQGSRLLHHISTAMETVGSLSRESGNTTVNVSELFTWIAIDVVSDLSFGESFDSTEKRMTHPWAANLVSMLQGTTAMQILGQWGLGGVMMLLTPKEIQRSFLESYQSVVSMIDRRMQNTAPRGDFFDHLVKHNLVAEEGEKDGATTTAWEKKPSRTSSSKGMTLSELHSTASDIGFAGSETTATVLSGIVFQLLRHPAVHEELVKEIRGSFTRASDIDSDSPSTANNPDALPYLEAVIQEGLRTYNPAPVFGSRSVPSGGARVAGVWLPEGTRVRIPPWVAYQSPLHFARPGDFIPERWFPIGGEGGDDDDDDDDDDDSKDDDNYNGARRRQRRTRPREFEDDNRDKVFHPFGFGPRNCIGVNLARAELRLTLAHLLWRFDLAKPDFIRGGEEDRKWERWMEEQRVWFMYERGPLMVSIKERGDI